MVCNCLLYTPTQLLLKALHIGIEFRHLYRGIDGTNSRRIRSIGKPSKGQIAIAKDNRNIGIGVVRSSQDHQRNRRINHPIDIGGRRCQQNSVTVAIKGSCRSSQTAEKPLTVWN